MTHKLPTVWFSKADGEIVFNIYDPFGEFVFSGALKPNGDFRDDAIKVIDKLGGDYAMKGTQVFDN